MKILPPTPKDLIKKIHDNPKDHNWLYIVQTYSVPEGILDKYFVLMYAYDICCFQKLSRNFIEKRFVKQCQYSKPIWTTISTYQDLSEEDIIYFKDYVSWSLISTAQKLSKEFIANNLTKLDLLALLSNNKIPEETKTYIRMFI